MGIYKVGDRIRGCMRFGAMASHLNVPASQVQKLPEDWSFPEGAAYLAQTVTSYYGMKELGGLQPGMTVLIHSVAGGCGLQAVAICLALGANVIGTVGLESKVQVVLDKFPTLRREQIIVRTGGHELKEQLDKACAFLHIPGFDITFDSLAGAYFQPSWDKLLEGGRHVVFGAGDMTPTSKRMGLLAWLRLARQWLTRPRLDPLEMPGQNKSLMAFNLIHCFNKPDLLLRMMEELDGLKLPKPMVAKVFPLSDAVQALRLLQSGTTSGKVVLDVNG